MGPKPSRAPRPCARPRAARARGRAAARLSRACGRVSTTPDRRAMVWATGGGVVRSRVHRRATRRATPGCRSLPLPRAEHPVERPHALAPRRPRGGEGDEVEVARVQGTELAHLTALG